MDAGGWRQPPSPSESRDLKKLTRSQRRRILERLARRWPPSEGAWWHPYTALPPAPETLCVESAWLVSELPLSEFRRRAALRWSKFWVIGEGAPHWDDLEGNFQGDFKISPRFVSPVLSSETVVVPTSLEWLAYTDHNEATYLQGEWLIETVKELWPASDQHIWTSPSYEHPPEDSRDHSPWWELGSQ